jgi:hypothetical protein
MEGYEVMILKRCVAVACALAVGLMLVSASPAARGSKKVDVSLELVGQVLNSPPGVQPPTSIQYGYVAYLQGLPIFNPGPAENESTARLSFYADTVTLRVTNNGPLRIISRDGTVTVYNDPAANGTFTNPDSFRDGTPVLVARLRQQVIINTLTGAFTALFVNKITATSPFTAGSEQVRLGKVGQLFRAFISGQVNSAGPPSAFIAGYTVPTDDPAKAKHRR